MVGVRKSFRRLNVLDGIDLSVDNEEFVSVLGPSGCGKTTLLKIAGGLLEQSGGQVLWDGAPLPERLGSVAGFVFQNPVLMPWRTVRQNVGLPLEILRTPNKPNGSSVDDMLRLVRLDDFGDSYPRELSGGMQQRAALARALVYRPSLLLMDEPFGSLDEITRERMNYELLRIHGETGQSILFVTHNLNEAVFMSDRVVILSDRPARVQAVVSVPLVRPRHEGLLSTPDYIRITECIRDLLHSS